MEHLDNLKLVVVETYTDAMLANLMKSKLEAAGIECALMDESLPLSQLYTIPTSGIKLKVLEDDLEAARDILNRVGEGEELMEEEAEDDVICPHCKSKDTVLASAYSNALTATWAMFLSSLPFYNKKRYYCKSCKSYFKIESKL